MLAGDDVKMPVQPMETVPLLTLTGAAVGCPVMVTGSLVTCVESGTLDFDEKVNALGAGVDTPVLAGSDTESIQAASRPSLTDVSFT